MEEPRYVEDPFEDYDGGKPRRPKWMIPSTDLQRRLLAAARRKYWPPKHQGGQTLRGKLILVEKSMTPLDTFTTIPEWPSEWVENCLKWFENRNNAGYLPLQAFFSLLENEDAKTEWSRRKRAKLGDDSPDYSYNPYK